ncbi:DUF3502 domain-containing protein [Paenibacillus lignilyticus]|uniref:DUF3502 domain-containing protein n=1 Tax=Paenibacillus lignilyticus TaxID=1172615 RepID=A0ABS5C9Z3_9BACL|nr:DUF3502 domain-containing protein [Paenibacillus lignilyticus]MBP3962827.1 DUF3502 domain-containing protein [Paenibacillus lignilyticus]
MRKKLHKNAALLVAATLSLSALAGCSGNNSEDNANKAANTTNKAAETNTAATNDTSNAAETTESTAPEEVTLEFYMPSPTANVNDLEAVLDKFYEETKDTLNTKIHFNFTTFDDIGQKVSLKLAAGEQVDSVFTAQWTNPNISAMISKDQLVNLDSYFNNDKYPGLKKAFTPEYLKNNSFADKTGSSHVYGIPFTHAFSGGATIYYRKDMAEKYGIGEIKSLADLEKFYDAVLANDKGIVPFTFNGSTDYVSDLLLTMTQPLTSKHNYMVNMGGTSVSVAIKPDGTAYAAKTIDGYSDPEFLKLLPEPMNTMDPLKGFKMVREWYKKGYLEKDILAQKDPDGQFMSGKAASVFRTLDIYSSESQQLETSIPGAKIGAYVITPGLMDGTAKAVGSDFKAWNFAAIPANSKNVDRTIAFFDWLFANQENHDLFEFGIAGKHWQAEGTTKYSYPATVDAATNYNFPGFTLTWNPTMVRYDSKTPDNIVTMLNNMGDTNFFYKMPNAGFSFVPDSVKTEVAKVSEVRTQLYTIGHGVVDDAAGNLTKIQKALDKAGYQKVVAEVEKQFNEFLKTNPYEGQ